MTFVGRHIISIRDFSKDDLLHVLSVAKQLEENPQPQLMNGKNLATLFFEPSTRTRLSFTSAMERLGGNVIGFDSSDSTSGKKGETLKDTIKMISQYADVIAMRHPLEGSARWASENASIPVLNAGDGTNQHPTQTLLDLYTIQKEFGSIDGLTVAFVGDLKYGRTVHSLCIALSHFNVTLKFIAPKELAMPASYIEDLDAKQKQYVVSDDLLGSLNDVDVIYMTRIQKERFGDPLEYKRLKGVYRITKDTLANCKSSVRVLHPLPRVDEICESVDDMEQAVYFKQAGNGIPVRQALIGLVTGAIS